MLLALLFINAEIARVSQMPALVAQGGQELLLEDRNTVAKPQVMF
jgi:hypothetical protein